MSASFEKFMAQYKQTGSEKADGYSRDVFIGLEPHEKEAVFVILKTELPWSAGWLFLLDPDNAINTAKAELQRLRGDPYAAAYLLQVQFLSYTGDLQYQQDMVDDYDTYADYLKPQVIRTLWSTPGSKNVTALFARVICEEADPDTRASASIGFLRALNVPHHGAEEKSDYDRLYAQLRSNDPESRRQAIDEIRERQRAT